MLSEPFLPPGWELPNPQWFSYHEIFSRLLTIGKEDVTGVSMIAIRPKTNMDVSLLVKVKKVDSVKNIKAKLFCGTADSPVHMVKMDGQKFVIFPSIPLDGSECHITVEASATQASHRVKTGRVYFNADKPIEHHQVFARSISL